MSFIIINKGCKLTQEGSEYRGNISVTMDGVTCLAWASQTPHPHETTDPDLFPDDTLEEAQNFCRNPDGSSFGPWCYTMDHIAPTKTGTQTATLWAKKPCYVPYCDSINTSMIYVALLISTYPMWC